MPWYRMLSDDEDVKDDVDENAILLELSCMYIDLFQIFRRNVNYLDVRPTTYVSLCKLCITPCACVK